MESEEVMGDNGDSSMDDSDLSTEHDPTADVDPNAPEFDGFSSPGSPQPQDFHETFKKLKSELEILCQLEDNAASGGQMGPYPDSIDIKQEPTSTYYNVSVKLEDICVPGRSGSQPAATLKRRGSRGSSPEESTSSRGSIQRSVSVSSGESHGSVKSEPKDIEKLTLNPGRAGSNDLSAEHKPLLPGSNDSPVEHKSLLPGSNDSPAEQGSSSAPSVRKSGRVPVPSSNYKIVERREEESRKRGGADPPMAPPLKREKLVLKLKPTRPVGAHANGKPRWSSIVPVHHHPAAPKGPMRKITKVEADPTAPSVPSASAATDDLDELIMATTIKKKSSSSRRKPTNADPAGYAISRRKDEPAPARIPDKPGEEEPRRVCHIKCPIAMGLIPTLQCCICLRLYHPECVDVGRTGYISKIHNYICKSCRVKPDTRKPEQAAEAAPPPLLPPQPPQPAAVPQLIVSLNRRRFVMVPNLSATPPAAPPGPALPQPGTLPLADLPASEPVAVLKPEGAALKKSAYRKEAQEPHPAGFMQNVCSGYTGLLEVLRYLGVADLLRAARVCRMWRDLALHPTLWQSVILQGTRVLDWDALASVLTARGTRHLDLRQLLPGSAGMEHLRAIKGLESVELGIVPVTALRAVLQGKQLRVVNAQLTADPEVESVRLDVLTPEHRLEELRAQFGGPATLPLGALDLSPVRSTLRVLSLRGLSNWPAVDTSCFAQLTGLTELEVGECSSLPDSFPAALSNLTQLQRVRLETGLLTCPTEAILRSLSQLPALGQLELINFDAHPNFDDVLASLTNIHTLLLIPTFVTQAGTKISSVLKGIYRLRDSLACFVWVFTLEFLQVTDLFVDKYSPTKATSKPSGDKSQIPVLTPLPVPEDTSGNPALWHDLSLRYSGTGADPIAVLPFTELQDMLANALPATRTVITKLPSQLTARQTLQQLLQ